MIDPNVSVGKFMFQFQTGSIKRRKRTGKDVEKRGFNSKLVRLKA